MTQLLVLFERRRWKTGVWFKFRFASLVALCAGAPKHCIVNIIIVAKGIKNINRKKSKWFQFILYAFVSLFVNICSNLKKKDEEGKSYCDALNSLRCNSHHQCKNKSPFWNFKFWLWAFFVFNNEKEKKQWRWRQQQRQKEVQFVIFSLFCFLLLSHKCMHLFSRHINVSGWVQTKWVFVIKMMYVSQSLRWIASHKKLLYNEFDVTFPFGCLISILWLVTALFFYFFLI